jgi:membrane-associated protease RseP (regulator of RpoE activity)
VTEEHQPPADDGVAPVPAVQIPGYSQVWYPPPPPPRLRFQHRYRTHIILFVLTVLTTTAAGMLQDDAWLDPNGIGSLWALAFSGLWYSVPILTILGAHEFGHYAYCRRHRVDATLPYFIPAPIPLTGTLGAVIRIREPFPSKQALFDIGVAGPIAGFIVLIPFLLWGMAMSSTINMQDAGAYFGEPLLFKLVEWLRFGALPEGVDSTLHPMAFAAWFGMLATALNLMPFGQLDGGHIAYAVLGRRAKWLSLATLIVAVSLAVFWSASWIAVAVMMMAMAFFLGIRHPRIHDEDVPLDRARMLVALFALIMFVICFTPVPIEIFQ